MRDAPDVIAEPLLDQNFGYTYVMNIDGSELHRVVPPHDRPIEWFNSSEYPQGWTDDGRIVFISSRDNTAANALDMRLYSVFPDGSALIDLTPTNWNTPETSRIVFYTALSPDGTQIAFTAKYIEAFDLYVINTDGSHLQQLTDDLRLESNFQWSPDGTQIVFVGDEDRFDDVPMDVFVINADGTGERNLTETSEALENLPHWSPDGTQIVFQSSQGNESNICFVNVDGTNLHCLMDIDGSVNGWLP
jgi:TolB protein